jgi:pimeloyl-ACP methyl ester carboxylesterase
MILPIPLLINFLIGLVSIALLVIACTLLYRAWRRYQFFRRPGRLKRRTRNHGHEQHSGPVEDRDLERPASPTEVLADRTVLAPLAIGLALLLVTFCGRALVHLAVPSGQDEPRELESGVVHYLQRPDGTKIRAEVFGRPDAPTLVFTHGWGTSQTEWYYAKRDLMGQFRLIFWDLRGLGKSSQPEDRDYALEKMASDLESVVTLANGKPVVLVGHSIGGMINLTFCRMFPDRLGHGVNGIIQVDTSYTNPVTTTKNAGLSRALQKPLAEPMLHAMIWFSPVVRAVNWLSYQNGTSQMMNAKSGFAGSETWGQVDLVSRYSYEFPPSVVARGTLAMFHWDAKPVLPRISVPVLLIVGEQDTTTLPSASEYMRQSIPNASLEKVSPSAHYGLLEQNRRYDSVIARFASACLRSNHP